MTHAARRSCYPLFSGQDNVIEEEIWKVSPNKIVERSTHHRKLILHGPIISYVAASCTARAIKELWIDACCPPPSAMVNCCECESRISCPPAVLRVGSIPLTAPKCCRTKIARSWSRAEVQDSLTSNIFISRNYSWSYSFFPE